MKIKYTYLLIFLCIISYNTYSQSFKFTADTAYINELSEYLQKSKKEEATLVFTQFSTFWNSGQLTDKQKASVIEVSNNLLKKRVRVFPHFYNFLRFVMSVLNAETQKTQFSNWIKVIENYSADKSFNSSEINSLFENLILLNDSGAFFESKAVIWKHNSSNYKLIYDVNSEPTISFDKTDLICYSKRDSAIIYQTKGNYYPLRNLWSGQGGTVTWERADFSKDSVFAKLNNYQINLKLPEYRADSVSFTNKVYLKSSLPGVMEEKVLANARGEKASFPKFESYNKRVDIKQVVPGIDYSGGFAMSGSKFLGYGDIENKAELFIYKKEDLFATANANMFTFDVNQIQGNNVKVMVSIEDDTLWHPGLNFNYLIKNKRVALTRSGGGLYRSKFYNTYHKLEIDVNEVSFNLEDTLILFKSPPATTYRKAVFDSRNFFSEADYEQIKLMDFMNPLEAVRAVAPSVDEEFEARHLANYLSKPESQCVNLLLRLSDFGFVDFDIDTKLAYPKQKLFDYIKSNYRHKDYDAIRIISEPPTGNNAVLNLNDKVLTIYGVKPFVLSENRRVGVIPENSTINIKKDLEIDFDGKLQAGLARIYGEGLTFHYDSFFVDLQKVDSLQLHYRSEEKNQDSLFEYSQVRSTVDSITGLLRIDEPENKSGIKTYDTYPVFESHQKSYVFYDINSEKDTVYNKQDFYFENYPFEIDSLNTITKNNVKIKGMFRSGGVFPDFEENLVVQPDSSLGFVHKLDSTGMPIYNGLGTYNNTITLNNSGLKGDGKVTFLNTSLYSSQFDFFPDSMNTFANKTEMLKQTADSLATKYPEGKADSVYVHWEPQRDQMFITSIDKPLNFFENRAKFEGTLKLQPKDLGGKGTLTFLDANLKSDNYTFYDESFTADTADFRLQPEPGSESPFLTYNVSADVDFTKKLGVFKSNGDNSYIEFPVNQYKCFMNYFSWHMGINQIDIGTLQSLQTDSLADVTSIDTLANNQLPEDVDLYNIALTDTSYSAQEIAARSKFLSTHPGQDSLSFYALSSSYDIKNFIIKARGVKFITVADAHIFPASTLVIQPDARIKPLNNARIVANRTSRYHTFYGATVNILGAKKYMGSGDYEYIDRLDSMQIIHFGEINVDFQGNTVASGSISQEDYFRLSPEFSYFGKTNIFAEQKFIGFDGYSMINHQCEKRMASYWLQFNATINPDSIVIPITEQPRDNELRKLQSNMYVTNDSMGVYTSFLTTQLRFSDLPVLKAKGYLSFNDTTGYFEICDSAKTANHEIDGNYLSFHKKLCLILGEGKMDLGVDLGQVKVIPTGKIRQNLDSWQTQMDVMLGVDFFFSEMALNSMASTLNESYTLPAVDLMSKEYQISFKELLGYQRSKLLTKDFALLGGFSTVPPEMNHSLFLSQVKLKWNQYYSAWESVDKIGIGNIKSTQINKFVDGFIEAKKSRGGDILNIYLEIDPKTWFFFTYTRGTLKTISSSDEYNNYIINLKDKERKSPDKDADTPYMFFPATERAKDNFVMEMKKRKEENKMEKVIDLDDKVTTNTDKKKEEAETELEQDEEFLQEDVKEKVVPIETEEIIEEEAVESEKKEEVIESEQTIKKEENKTEENTEIKTEKSTEESKKVEDPNKIVNDPAIKKDDKKELKDKTKEKKTEVKKKKEEEEEEEIPEEEEEEEEG